MSNRIARFMCFVDVEITDPEWGQERVREDLARQLNFAVSEHQDWLRSEGHDMPYEIDAVFAVTALPKPGGPLHKPLDDGSELK